MTEFSLMSMSFKNIFDGGFEFKPSFVLSAMHLGETGSAVINLVLDEK